jgi:hypothetical protein
VKAAAKNYGAISRAISFADSESNKDNQTMPFETALMNFENSSMWFLVTTSDGTLIAVATHQLILIPANPSH